MARILSMAALALLAGCASYDRHAMTSFEPSGDSFRFEANADPVIYPLDSAAAEQDRMVWLETYLSQNNMCPDGYTITERKPVITGEPLTGTDYRIFYQGHCT